MKIVNEDAIMFLNVVDELRSLDFARSNAYLCDPSHLVILRDLHAIVILEGIATDFPSHVPKIAFLRDRSVLEAVRCLVHVKFGKDIINGIFFGHENIIGIMAYNDHVESLPT